MSDAYLEVLNAVKLKLKNAIRPTQDEIKSAINKGAIYLDIELGDTEIELMAKELEAAFQITIKSSSQLVKNGWEPWMHLRSEEQKKDFYTNRYRNFLTNNTDMPNSVISEIFQTTDKILDCMANPLSKEGFKKKGLVVGHVQSGKTANFIALVNKAADVGYKLIIVIAGVHNNLRMQTQIRVNEGFVGFDAFKMEAVGVGIGLDGDTSKRPISFTSTQYDFRKSNLNQLTFDPVNSNVPVVLVIKKNSSTLKNILDWLSVSKDKDIYTNNYPMLIIDDEADNASINTKKHPDEATTINKRIREILNLFSKVSYVGFTATPFANIFIDPDADHKELNDDLFPDDFIISLETPSNYFGAKKVFIDESEKYIRTIPEDDESLPIKLPKDFDITELPDNFYDALHLFILSIGIKKIRGIKNPHTSMLVNVTYKNEYQKQVVLIIQDYLDVLLSTIKYEYKKPLSEALKKDKIANLYRMWVDEYNSCEDFLKILDEVVKLDGSIKSILVNSTKSSGSLNYSEYAKSSGLHVVAVGGYSLSRGFTLEGLTISYLLRNTAMYDTLLQMGRWFGYRDGYDDLCRVYITERSSNWYAHIASVIEELREEFKVLEYHKQTPKEYGLKVRTHPEQLLITAKNKMYNSQNFVLSTSYSASLAEVKALGLDDKTIVHNRDILKAFLHDIGTPCIIESKGYYWQDIATSIVLKFLHKFKFHISDTFEMDSLKKYVEDGANLELANWDIYMPANGNGEVSQGLENFELKMQKRSVKKKLDNLDNYASFKDGGGRIVRFFDEEIGLSKEQLKKAEEIRKNRDIKQSGEPYRQCRTKPLLVIKMLQIACNTTTIAKDVVAFGISFPKSAENRFVEFRVNKVWIQKNLGEKLDEDEDEEREDD